MTLCLKNFAIILSIFQCLYWIDIVVEEEKGMTFGLSVPKFYVSPRSNEQVWVPCQILYAFYVSIDHIHFKINW